MTNLVRWEGGKFFADLLAWSVSIVVHQIAVPCEKPLVHVSWFFFSARFRAGRGVLKKSGQTPRLTTCNWENEKVLFPSCSSVLFVTPRDRNSSQKSFSHLSRYDPKLFAHGLRPNSHNKNSSVLLCRRLPRFPGTSGFSITWWPKSLTPKSRGTRPRYLDWTSSSPTQKRIRNPRR